MTTAHKPTWNPAKATENSGFLANGPSMSFSSRDVASHTKLKFRSSAQASASREALEEREKLHIKDLKRGRGDEDVSGLLEDDRAKRRKMNSDDAMSEDERHTSSAMQESQDSDAEEAPKHTIANKYKDIDADDSSGSESSDSDDDSDDDDMAELERELEKIRRERKEEQERQQKEREEADRAQEDREIMMANPLLAEASNAESGDFTVRRKWWEESVFRNQAKAEPQYKKRFINDTLRNDFHKRFLNKFIK